MNYQQTLDYLFAKLPMFTRVGVSAYKKDLGNTIRFCKHLNHPETKFKSVHIGGTNGKGSTSHILAAVLQEAGYKTGLYTSPHLKDFRERIKIDGEMISEQEVVDFVKENKKFIEEISPSFFEATVAMAFEHFAKHKVDIAVIEVGLGGRLDSTNVIKPEVAVITNISLDHTNLLGNTLPEIAFEKAGIIKENTPIVIGQHQPEVSKVFEEKAEEKESLLVYADREWQVLESFLNNGFRDIKLKNQQKEISFKLDLTGTYQEKNIKTVLATLQQLATKGFTVSDENLQLALSQVKNKTGLMGRWQILATNPLTICDTGHNEDGIKEVVHNISLTQYDKLHFVLGMVKDKDVSTALSLLPKNATYYFCAPSIERAKPTEELRLEAKNQQLNGLAYADVTSAFNAAKENATVNDFIFIGGSTFVVAEIV